MLVEEGGFRLGNHNSVILQGRVNIFEELFLVEAHSRSDGISRIDQDDIEDPLMWFDILNTVLDDDFHPGIIHFAAHEGEELLALLDYQWIDLHQLGPGNCGMFHHLPNGSPVSAANDENMLGMRMGEKRDVGDHFMIREFILFREHNRTLQDEGSSVVVGIHDFDLLEVTVAAKYPFLYLYRIADGVINRLGKPKIHFYSHRITAAKAAPIFLTLYSAEIDLISIVSW